jgi:sulfatase modifying factor 1
MKKELKVFMLIALLCALMSCGGGSSSTKEGGISSIYTVTFDSQSATVAADPASITVTSPATTVGTLPTPPTKTNNNFEGWFTEVNGGGTAFTVSTAVTANITVYASWTLLDYISPNIGTLKYVPAGSFQRDAASTNISIITTAFRMSEKEITMEQFVVVTGLSNPSADFTAVVNGPVQYVSWYHALVFCNKLSIAEGLDPVYTIKSSTAPDDWDGTTDDVINVPASTDFDWDEVSANWSAGGYRLPTEMEWMWAAMGSTSGYGYTGGIFTTGYSKPFAGSDGTNAIGDYAWYDLNSGASTHPVGTTGTTGNANELSLYDMSGNVSEWCWDWIHDLSYPIGTLTDYRGYTSGPSRVARGGNWDYTAGNATVALRSGGLPSDQDNRFGFRVVRK